MLRNWFTNFMMGRYGPDQLGLALVIGSLLMSLLSSLTRFGLLGLAGYVLVFFAFFRFLSRNLEKRRAENDRFIKYWWPIRTKLKNRLDEVKSAKQYKFFRCPSCKNRLRVPRGKGRIRITCPKCGLRFEKKT